jgi:DNA mismatch repair protein MutH
MPILSLPPPTDVAALMARAHGLAGRTLGQIAADLGVAVPADLRRHKGWGGQLVEAALGAAAGSLAEPDFPHLGVELKTLPVDARGRPRESTYVCTVPIDRAGGDWERSWLRRKLAQVLWLPVQGDPALPPAERRVGTALLWRPDAEEEAQLRTDWEELMELIALGGLDQVTARFGRVLQIRPKAAHSRVLGRAIGPAGQHVLANPRGFYLRPGFTAAILARFFATER